MLKRRARKPDLAARATLARFTAAALSGIDQPGQPVLPSTLPRRAPAGFDPTGARDNAD